MRRGGRKNENLRKFLLHFVKRCGMITKLSMRHAPLAQLDRASGYGPEGRGFESLTACHPETVTLQRFRGFALHTRGFGAFDKGNIYPVWSKYSAFRTQLTCAFTHGFTHEMGGADYFDFGSARGFLQIRRICGIMMQKGGGAGRRGMLPRAEHRQHLRRETRTARERIIVLWETVIFC